jgi:hypothetical protein
VRHDHVDVLERYGATQAQMVQVGTALALC